LESGIEVITLKMDAGVIHPLYPSLSHTTHDNISGKPCEQAIKGWWGSLKSKPAAAKRGSGGGSTMPFWLCCLNYAQ
jgi:hypothetical protein